MEHKEEEDDQSTLNHSVAKAHLIHSSELRKIAMEKKNKRQEEKANQALKQCGDAAVKSGVSPGAVVILRWMVGPVAAKFEYTAYSKLAAAKISNIFIYRFTYLTSNLHGHFVPEYQIYITK